MSNMDMMSQNILVTKSYLRKRQLLFILSFDYSSIPNPGPNLLFIVKDKTMIVTTTPNNIADIGRVKKIIKPPSDNIRDRLKLISIIGPNTNARMNGASS